MGDCSDPADHLVWERWQFIDLRIQGGMFVRSSGEGAAKMHVSRFDVLVTLAYVTSTVLWVVVPVGWPKTSTPPCHRPPRIERRDGAHGRTRTAGLLLTKDVLYRHRGPRDQQHTSLRNREDWPFYLPNFWTTCGQKFATGLLRLSP